jgi:predicted nuclease of restriction endonuclease-like (RecB) superfamily
MKGLPQEYSDAVRIIKQAILESQYRAAKMISGEQLSLYFGIGCYVSENSRKDSWGTGAIDAISAQLRKELPGLHGFSAESIKKMRTFAEFWRQFINRPPSATDLQIAENKEVADYIQVNSFALQNWSPLATEINRDDFLGISFSHHMEILNKTKDIDTVLFYIHQTVLHRWDKYTLRGKLKAKIHESDHELPNNFVQTIASPRQAMQAVKMFKDEYLLDFINLEDIDADEDEDVDERIVERDIVRNIKRFIMMFGKDFSYIGNQYHLELYGEELKTDLLFFNRALNCLVAIELKGGKFKTAYLGQLYGYLKVLDDQVRKPHENPSIGIVLCRSANRAFAEYAVRDYNSPMGVATYKTLADMPKDMQEALPDIEDLKKLL